MKLFFLLMEHHSLSGSVCVYETDNFDDINSSLIWSLSLSTRISGSQNIPPNGEFIVKMLVGE